MEVWRKPVGENNIHVHGSCPIQYLRSPGRSYSTYLLFFIAVFFYMRFKPSGFHIIVPIVLIIWISQSMLKQYGTSAIRCRTIGTVMERFHSRSQQLCIHTKRVQLLQDWFGTPTLLPFHCFGTPRLRTGRHEKKGLYDDHSRLEIAKVYRYICWLVSLKWSRPSRDHASCPKNRDDYIQPG